jgi:hypothetical protein
MYTLSVQMILVGIRMLQVGICLILLHVEVIRLWLRLGWMIGYYCFLMLIEFMEKKKLFPPMSRGRILEGLSW